MVATLRPRVREEREDRVEALRRQVRQQDEGITVDDANVGEPRIVDERQQVRHAGRVDFHGEVVAARVGGSDGGGRVTHAGADLQDDGCAAPEHVGGL